jgi:hypothetical protein
MINVRVQTYAPFATQIIINGHRIIHEMLVKNNVKHIVKDNAITQCDSIDKAQGLSDKITDEFINDNIRRIFREYIPCLSFVPCGYRLTIRQIEYSSDIIFSEKVNIHERYTAMIPRLLQQKPDDILRFTDSEAFSKVDVAKLECRYYQTRFGSCIKFTIGNVSIKMYTKDDFVLRIETTCRDMESIRGLRTVFHKDGSRSIKRRPLTRSIYSLQLFINYARRANNRFTDTIQTAMNNHFSCKDLKQTTTPVIKNGRSMKGFNYFDPLDQRSLIAISNEKLNLLPFSRATFKNTVGEISDYQASHLLKRLRSHGLIKKLPKSRLYYPTKIGKKTCLTMMYMTNEVVKPIMAA